MSIFIIAGQCEESKIVAIATQGNAKNLPDTLQGAGRARIARRFLLEFGRLVSTKCAGRRFGQLCVSVECMH